MSTNRNLAKYELPIEVPPVTLLAGLGHQALEHEAASIDFPLMRYQTLFLGSHGGTKEDVAALQGRGVGAVEEDREAILETFEVKSFATAVHRAIKIEFLPIEVNPNPELTNSLDWRDRIFIEGFRQGYTNADIARTSGMSKSEMHYYANSNLFRRIHVSGRTESVRKSHEIGLRIPKEIPELYADLGIISR